VPRATAEIVLHAPDRFDLRATVLSHGYFELAPCRWRDGRRPVLVRAEALGPRRVYRLEIRPAPPRGVVLRATGHDADEAEVLAPLAARVRTALRLDHDLRDFRRLCRSSPSLRPLARLGAGRILHGTTLFEDLVKAIAWTNTTWAGAVATIARLGALGPPCPVDRTLRAFPSAAALARIDADELRLRTGLGYRARHVAALARDVEAGTRDLDALAAAVSTLPRDTVVRELRTIAGVGPATAGYVAAMLGRTDVPVVDRATLRWMRAASGASTPEAVARRAARWGRFAGLALWWTQWLASRYPALLRARL